MDDNYQLGDPVVLCPRSFAAPESRFSRFLVTMVTSMAGGATKPSVARVNPPSPGDSPTAVKNTSTFDEK